MHHPTLVNDALLKRLSQETRLVGRPVLVKGSNELPEHQAVIINVVIVPFSDFYRKLFMRYYLLYKKNAVKALKQLIHYFPKADHGLDIGYVLGQGFSGEAAEPEQIRHRSDFMLLDDLGAHRRSVVFKVQDSRFKVGSGTFE